MEIGKLGNRKCAYTFNKKKGNKNTKYTIIYIKSYSKRQCADTFNKGRLWLTAMINKNTGLFELGQSWPWAM